jgi:hypothetical protein
MKVTPEQLEKAVEAACEAGKLKDRFVANNLRVTVAAALASLPEPQAAVQPDHCKCGAAYLRTDFGEPRDGATIGGVLHTAQGCPAVQPVDGDVEAMLDAFYKDGPHDYSYDLIANMTAAYRVCMASRPDAAALRAQAFAEAQSEMAAVMRECNYPLENVAGILDAVVKRLTPPQEPTLEEKIRMILNQYRLESMDDDVTETAVECIAALMEENK